MELSTYKILFKRFVHIISLISYFITLWLNFKNVISKIEQVF